MLRKGMTVDDAAHEWVKEFNAIDSGIIEKLMNMEPEDWTELTVPVIGDTVYSCHAREEGEIVGYDEDDDLYRIELNSGEIIEEDERDLEICDTDAFPMWGKMWSFGDSLDDYWLTNQDGIRIMSECGFRIYESAEYGYFFGVDGAGYDFYEAHWIPLYKARGLAWHDPDTEKGEKAEW